MINGPGYLYIEIPRCGTTLVGDILINQCEGTRITPRHDPLTWEVDKDTVVFATVRKPYRRMESLWLYMDENPSSFSEWYGWVKDRETGIHVDKPYTFWTKNCNNVLRMEQLEERLPPLMKKLGFKVDMPEVRETDYNRLTQSDRQLIKEERLSDFTQFGYKFNANSKI